MSIQQPRRFVTTDQGHADILNVPIDTLYTNDQGLAAQIESIKKDPAANGVASKEALESHASSTDLHVTAAKQAAWSAAEANAKKYTEQYAAPKQHSHPASDLPSASTQARGIVQLNTSVSSGATDQASTSSATKQAYDRANEAYSLAQQAFQAGVNVKQSLVDDINAKRGNASTSMSWQELGTAIKSIGPVKATINNSYAVDNVKSQTGTYVYGPTWFTFPANTTFIAFTATDITSSYQYIRRGPGTTGGGSPLFLLTDANGYNFVFLQITKGSGGLKGDTFKPIIRSFTFDARTRELTIVWYEPRVSVFSVPSNFDVTREFQLRVGALMGPTDESDGTPAGYGAGLKGNLLYL
ncbi:phage tail protein [Paenibacillus kribbensis]|uniref:phage tail protein n=1 Tax=Paenibacillus kribbensis TaxID=172713 RepID=UPI002DB9B867|nr:phage tail protein [Paenibacillus kribbensis]MEC0233083.1 phage tail protein [Paenibacillus kribbensis]